MASGDLIKAKDRLSLVSARVGLNFTRIVEFMRLANAGTDAIQRGTYRVPDLRIPDEIPPEFHQLLKDVAPKLRISGMLGSSDAAALVFAHAILDDLVTECCKISAVADPSAWESAI